MNRWYARYRDPEQLVRAARALHAQGHVLEAYTPFPVEELREALGLARSRIPLLAFVLGMTGAGVTYFVQWFIEAWSYPIDVGARPPHFPLAFVPVCFEVGILCAALGALGAVAVVGRFGQLWDPVFELPQFRGVSRDEFWLQLSSEDGDAARRALAATEPQQILEGSP